MLHAVSDAFLLNQGWSLSLVTAPTAEPLTLPEAKAHLRVDFSDEDQYITDLIASARRHLERKLDRTFLPTSWRLSMDYFPPWEIRLPRPPLVSITSVTYAAATDGTSTTHASSNYSGDAYSEPGRLTPVYNQVWPAVRIQANSVAIVYVGGYGSTNALALANLPGTIKHAMKLLVAHWYANREPVNIGNIVTPIDETLDSLLASEDWGRYR